MMYLVAWGVITVIALVLNHWAHTKRGRELG